MENLIKGMPSVEAYKEMKNNVYFMPLLTDLGFTKSDLEDFERKYYPELLDKESQKQLITKEWLEGFLNVYKSYAKKVNNLYSLGVDPYAAGFPLDDCEKLLLRSLSLLFNDEDKYGEFIEYCNAIDDGEEQPFDELCKKLDLE